MLSSDLQFKQFAAMGTDPQLLSLLNKLFHLIFFLYLQAEIYLVFQKVLTVSGPFDKQFLNKGMARFLVH